MGLYIVDNKDWDENPIGVEKYPATPGAPSYSQLNSPAANYRLRAFSGCGSCGMGADASAGGMSTWAIFALFMGVAVALDLARGKASYLRR